MQERITDPEKLKCYFDSYFFYDGEDRREVFPKYIARHLPAYLERNRGRFQENDASLYRLAEYCAFESITGLDLSFLPLHENTSFLKTYALAHCTSRGLQRFWADLECRWKRPENTLPYLSHVVLASLRSRKLLSLRSIQKYLEEQARAFPDELPSDDEAMIRMQMLEFHINNTLPQAHVLLGAIEEIERIVDAESRIDLWIQMYLRKTEYACGFAVKLAAEVLNQPVMRFEGKVRKAFERIIEKPVSNSRFRDRIFHAAQYFSRRPFPGANLADSPFNHIFSAAQPGS